MLLGLALYALIISGQGTFKWIDQFGSYGSDVGYCAVSDGNARYVAGWFENTVSFGQYSMTSYGSTDIFLVRLDSMGNVMWCRHFGGYGYDYVAGLSTDHQGNLYFSGWFYEDAYFDTFHISSYGLEDAFICRITTDGEVKWVLHGGGLDTDQAIRVNVSPTGTFIVFTGYYRDYAQFGPFSFFGSEGREFFIARVDTNGTYKWVFSAPGNSDEVGYGIDVDPFGNIYSLGYFYSYYWLVGSYLLINQGEFDCSLMKIDSAGNLIWAKRFGGYYDDVPRPLIYYDNYLYIGGYHYGQGDFLGIPLSGMGGRDQFVVKADTLGNGIWACDGISLWDDEMIQLDLDSTGNVYSSGGFNGVLQFGTASFPSFGLFDAFCLKIDGNNGNPLKAITGGGIMNDMFFGVSVIKEDTIILTGYFSYVAKFGSNWLVSSGYNDIIIAETSDLYVSVQQPESPQNFIIYPNPARDHIICRFNGSVPSSLIIYNSYGKIVMNAQIPMTKEITIDCSQLSAGFYYLIFDEGTFGKGQKFLISGLLTR
jgi:hypothetical protein